MNVLLQKARKKKEFLAALFIMLWVGVAFFLFHEMKFESNDDNSMARMAYGMIGEYETHLVFINVFVGQCLKLMLTLFPGIPWYTVFQLCLVWISFFTIVYLIFKRFGIKGGLLPVFLLIAGYGIQFFVKIQFSKTAGISTLAGVLLLFDGVNTEERFARIRRFVAAGVLTIAGSMYRFNLFGMILLALCGVGVGLVWKPLIQKNWKRLLQICLPFVVVFGLCFGFRVYDLRSYQCSEDWAAYKEFNSLRAQLMDYGFPDYEENRELYESLDISEADLEIYKGWDFADSEKFTTEVMRQLVNAKAERTLTVKEGLGVIKDFFTGYDYSSALILAIIICIATCVPGKRWLMGWLVGAATLVQVYLYYIGRYGVNRVDVGLSCALFVVLILHCWGKMKNPGKMYCTMMACLVVISPLSGIDYENITVVDNTKYEEVQFYELLESDPNSLYIRPVSCSLTRVPRVLEWYPVGYQSNSCSLGGWGTYTVPYLQMWERYDITNPYRDIVDHPSVYFVSTKDPTSYVTYIQEHYAPDANCYLVKVTEDGYPIYRISTKSGPTIDTSDALVCNGYYKIYYAISAEQRGDGTCFYGYLYMDDINSFASDIYFSLTNAAGEETLYYTQQAYTDAFGGLTNGAYSIFSVILEPEGTEYIKLYLQTDEMLYCVDIGAVDQIVP